MKRVQLKLLVIPLSLLLFMTVAPSLLQAQIRSDNTRSFKWIRSVHGQNQRPYSDGFAAFYEAGKWGYENADGDIVIPAQYDEAGDFSGGIALIKKDGKWGVITPDGKEIYK